MQSPTSCLRGPTALAVLTLASSALSSAQVHHFPDGRPWDQRADSGPDAQVDGWFYQLGITGIRVKLDDDHPTHLIVGHVFEGAPAEGRVEIGDHIVGAGGKPFETPHQNGYGMEFFGAVGPVSEFAAALEAATDGTSKASLRLTILRDGKESEARIPLGRAQGKAPRFAETFPFDCKRTESLRKSLLESVADSQRDDGSFGNPIHNTFAPLALLASGNKKYRAAVKKNARFHAQHTTPENDASLVNWRYMSAAIVLSEWYLATGDKWVIRELQEVYDFLISTQYMSLDQVSEAVRESHPDSYPKNAEQQRGGWGHNPGFEGYGPIAMLTGQGALAFALMERCGIEVDEARHRAAYDFLARGTGKTGYLWYGDDAASDTDWADMGRTGASGLAHAMSPFPEHGAMALRHATLIGEQPNSFPDTHASPLMGMGYTAAAAFRHEASFRRLMAANRWWFILADCGDGTFHYQPNRDNAGYGADARAAATAVTAFILCLPDAELAIAK